MKRFILLALISVLAITGYAQDKQPATQCQEFITSKHRQCLNPAIAGKNYCYVHDKGIARCGDDIPDKAGGRTAKGLPCKNKVNEKGQRCNRHQFQK